MVRTPPSFRILTTIGLVAMLISVFLGGRIGNEFEWRRQTQQLESDLSLRRELLRSEIERHRLLPETLAGDSQLARAIDPAVSTNERRSLSLALSGRFEQLARSDGAATLYLIDANGTTVASSNYRSPDSFVGQNYSFRSYFVDARRDGAGMLFARGTVSRKPGLYLAHRLDGGGGVVVVKVEFDDIELGWRKRGEQTFVTNEAGEVLLTSNPDSRFKILLDLGKTDERRMIDARATLDAPRWTLTVRRDVGDAVRTARNIGWLTAGLLGALLTLILGTILVARERRERTQRELESLVEQRTEELRNSNQRLVLEIDERARADARVQKLRDDLVQANRLAVLGQISAGVAHEINQPVAAIRTNVDNAAVLLARGRQTECEENLRAIVSLTDRIGLITDELREFARRTPIEPKPTRLAAAIDGACILLDARLRSASITLHKNVSPTDPQVIANRTKIEQVIVNLLQNAIEALADTSMPTITIETGSSATGHWIAIRDNGPGIPDAQRDELFVPFSSTKPLGLGLGLVICRDIMADLGGTLDFESVAGPGARFVARFPAREIA